MPMQWILIKIDILPYTVRLCISAPNRADENYKQSFRLIVRCSP
jgi:hypothetical protein